MSPDARSAWMRTLARHLLILAGALVLGLLSGKPWVALAVAAIALLAWNHLKLHRLLQRLTSPKRPSSAAGSGAWNQIDQQLQELHGSARSRRLRLVAMLRAYRAAAAALPDAIVVLERDSQRVQWFNEAATRLLGLRYPQDIDASLSERVQPLAIARWLSAGRHAQPMTDAPSPVDPGRRLHLRLIPYSEELWLLIARDVTKLMRLEHMRRDFVANVSHELRTPLTVVHGYLELLDPAERPEWAPMLAEMQRQSQRMTQLVEDLLTLSRLEAQDHVSEEQVAMTPMLATLRREAEALSQGRHAIDVIDEAGVDLLGSTRELHSAFSNLVSNAVRYTPAGGVVGVAFRREGDELVLSVRDSGYGIPTAHLPRLTERFYRVSTSRSRESGGTGLGLAIVKHVLNLHQAQLQIQSEVGCGSTFTCRFDGKRARERAGTT